MSPNLIRAQAPYEQHLAKDLEFLSQNINDLHRSFTSQTPASASTTTTGGEQGPPGPPGPPGPNIPATATTLGSVIVGANINVAGDGTISVAVPYTLPVATSAVLGGVKQGSGVTIAGDGTLSVTASGVGTVTSVGLSMPVEFSVTNSPVTGAGTIAVSKANQVSNTVYAGPASGSAPPAFRMLLLSDMPNGITPQVNSDWNASSGVAMILNKPTIPGTYTLPPATASVLGGVKVGANITVAGDGTISVAAPTAAYVLPVATASVLGGIKDGTGITVAADGTLSWDTTQTPPVTFNGLVTANAGMTVKNNNPVGFFEPTNTFTQFQIICGSGGNFNLQWRPDSVTAFNNILSSNTGGAVNFAGPAASFNGTLAVTGTSTFTGNISANGSITVYNTATILTTAAAGNPSLRVYGNTTSTPFLDIGYDGSFPYLSTSGNCLRISGTQSLKFGNAQYGDTNDGRINMAGVGAAGLNIVGGNTDNTNRKISFWGSLLQQDGAGALIGGTTTLNNLTINGPTTSNNSITIQGSGTLAVYAGGTGVGYIQIINNGNTAGTGRNNPAIYSSGGNIDLFSNVFTYGTLTVNGASTLTGNVTCGGFVATNTIQANGGDGYIHFANWIKVDTIAPQSTASVSISVLTTTTTGVASINCAGWGVKFPNIGTTPHVHAFYWSGSMQAYVDGASVGTITITSERWMKEDIQAYGRGLDVIRQLKPVSYKYVPQPWRGLGQTHYGLIADEVEPVAPEMIELQTTQVEGEEKKVRFVDPRPLWFMLVNAMQELDKRLGELEQRKVN
jgi:hypothetical protein